MIQVTNYSHGTKPGHISIILNMEKSSGAILFPGIAPTPGLKKNINIHQADNSGIA